MNSKQKYINLLNKYQLKINEVNEKIGKLNHEALYNEDMFDEVYRALYEQYEHELGHWVWLYMVARKQMWTRSFYDVF